MSGITSAGRLGRSAWIEPLEARRLMAMDLAGAFVGAVPTAVSLTKPTTVKVALRNAGDATAAGTATVTLHASTDGTDAGEVATLGTPKSHPVRLRAGQTLTLPLQFSAPAGLADGSYYLVADVAGTASDGSASAAAVATSSTVVFAKPFVSLTGTTALASTGTVAAGGKGAKPVVVTVTVTNAGNEPAKGKLAITVEGSDAAGIGPASVTLLATPARGFSLAAGKSKAIRVTGKPTAATAAGTYAVVSSLNYTGTFASGNTAAIVAAGASRVTVANAAVPRTVALSSALTADKTAVKTGSAQPVTFSVGVAQPDVGTAVTVEEVDSAGTVLGTVATLTDGGTDGDATTADGTFAGTAQLTFTTPAARLFVPVVTELGTPLTPATPPTPLSIAGLAVGAISDGIRTVVVGHAETVRLSVPTAGASANESVEVDQVDASGNYIGKLDALFDDGSSAHADAVAGDGTFGAINTISFGAPGTQYYQAKITDNTTGAVTLGPILPIAGVDAPSQAQLQADADDGVSINQVGANVLAGGGTPAAAVAAVVAALAGDADVLAGSVQTSGHAVSWESTDGVSQGFDANALTGASQRGNIPLEIASGATTTPTASPSSPVATPADTSAESLGTAVGIDPFNWQFSPDDETSAIASILNTAGYSAPTTVDASQSDANVSLDSFKNLGSNDAIFIIAHGALLPSNGEDIVTGVHTSVTSMLSNVWDLLNGRLTMVAGYYAVTPSFVTAYDSGMDGTIVYLGLCYSLATNDMAAAFTGAGAAAVVGYSDVVNSDFAYQKGQDMFNTLVKTDPASNRIEDIPGINVVRDPTTPFALFKSSGDPTATLNKGDLLKNYDVYVKYNWPQTQSDLDSDTSFLGSSVGYALGSSPYLNWSGDDTSSGGTETTTVDLYDAWTAGRWATTTTVGVGCDWYSPADGSGPAVITIALQNKTTGVLKHVFTESVNPGQETYGASTQVATVNVTLIGDPTNPTVKITES